MKYFKTLILISLGFLCLPFSANAQYVPGAFGLTDIALQLSQTNRGGSARIQAIGGAQISLGGDISAASANPAGLGFFRRSEFSISPSYNVFNTQSSYFGTVNNEFDTRLNFANIGVVFNNTKDDIVPGAWRGGSFAISINKVNDFNGRFFYEGFNNESSIVDYLTFAADGIPAEELGAIPDLIGLSYLSFLINPTDLFNQDGRDDTFVSTIFADQFPTQNELMESRGGQYQWSFAYGGNFADKFYIGATLGVSNIRYELEKDYREIVEPESDLTNIAPGVDFTILEDLRIDGIGINGTIGFIYKPVPFFNIGATFTTPTIINVDEETFPTMQYVDFSQQNMTTGQENDFYTFDYNFIAADTSISTINRIEGDRFLTEYRITTPFKASLGATAFLGKYGFISADVDYVNYASQKFRSRDLPDIEKQINRDLFELYQEVLNFRVGAELRYNIFRFRGGFAYNPSPYKNDVVYQDEIVDRSQTSITAGAGIKLPKFFVDLAFVNTRFNSIYSPYVIEPLPVVVFDNNFSSTTLTAGFYF